MLFTVAFLLASISAGTAVADHPNQNDHIEAMQNPSVTLNVTSSAFYNLTFTGMLLHAASGVYGAMFSESNWHFYRNNSTSYSYTSNVPMVRTAGQVGDFSDGGGNGHHNNGGPQGGMLANVTITLNALGYSLDNISLHNVTIGALNDTFPAFSVMEMTVSVVFNTPVQAPSYGGMLQLFQLIKSSNESKSAARYYLGNLTENHDGMPPGNFHGPAGGHRGMVIQGNGTAKQAISAYYWWNNTFLENNNTTNLTSSVIPRDQGIFITFNFPFNGTLHSIYQDPYFGIPGSSFFNNPVIHKDITQVVNYLVIHAEYFATGIAGGIAILGTSYSVYRKRRF